MIQNNNLNISTSFSQRSAPTGTKTASNLISTATVVNWELPLPILHVQISCGSQGSLGIIHCGKFLKRARMKLITIKTVLLNKCASNLCEQRFPVAPIPAVFDRRTFIFVKLVTTPNCGVQHYRLVLVIHTFVSLSMKQRVCSSLTNNHRIPSTSLNRLAPEVKSVPEAFKLFVGTRLARHEHTCGYIDNAFFSSSERFCPRLVHLFHR